MEAKKTGIAEILSLSDREVVLRNRDRNPAESIFATKVNMLMEYNSRGLLYQDSANLLQDELFLETILGKDSVKRAEEYLSEMGVQDLFIPSDMTPLLHYALLADKEHVWRYLISNLSPKSLTALIESSIMNQDLFEIIYKYYRNRNIEGVLPELDRLAEEYGFEIPEILGEAYLESFNDDNLLNIVLNVEPENLQALAASSPKFARFLNSKRVLGELSVKYRVLNAESLAEFIENYKTSSSNAKRSEEVFERLKKAILNRDESMYTKYIKNTSDLEPKKIHELALLAVDQNLLFVVKDMLNLMATQNIFYYSKTILGHGRYFQKKDLIEALIQRTQYLRNTQIFNYLQSIKHAYMASSEYNQWTGALIEYPYILLK